MDVTLSLYSQFISIISSISEKQGSTEGRFLLVSFVHISILVSSIMDLRQTPQYAKYIKLLNWQVEEIDNSFIFVKKIPIIGSVIKLQRSDNINYQFIDELAIKHRAFQISIEPKSSNHQSLITDHRFRLSRSPSLCSKTVNIDLMKPENKLLSEMHHKTRYNIKVAKKRGVKVNISKDINRFSEFWQECALKQRHMFLPMKREINAIYTSFGKDTRILFANKDKTLLAAILLIYTKDTAYYMYAASTGQGKKLFAPTLVAWKSIKLAKKLGCKLFDFEGIYDERFPIPSWKGFSRFKKSFGGKVIEYPGSFVKYRIPL